jgi:probable rRNA maturation factor
MEISIYNRQRKFKVNTQAFHQWMALALPQVMELKTQKDVLSELQEVEISIVSAKRIRQVHQEFMALNTVTDVITFQHGEIIVCGEVAAEEALNYGWSFEEELGLYMVHGLMHLAGWDDHEEEECRQMHNHQLQILRRVAEK